jgi:hypothetical protein
MTTCRSNDVQDDGVLLLRTTSNVHIYLLNCIVQVETNIPLQPPCMHCTLYKVQPELYSAF